MQDFAHGMDFTNQMEEEDGGLIGPILPAEEIGHGTRAMYNLCKGPANQSSLTTCLLYQNNNLDSDDVFEAQAECNDLTNCTVNKSVPINHLEQSSTLDVVLSADGYPLQSLAAVSDDHNILRSSTDNWTDFQNGWGLFNNGNGTQTSSNERVQTFENLSRQTLDNSRVLQDTFDQNCAIVGDYTNEISIADFGPGVFWSDLGRNDMLIKNRTFDVQPTNAGLDFQGLGHQNFQYTPFLESQYIGLMNRNAGTNPIPQFVPVPSANLLSMATSQLATAQTAAAKPCTHPGCSLTFDRDWERTRHEASKHGINLILYHCPISGCSKHITNAGVRAYKRADKLKEHMWRKHADQGHVKRSIKRVV